jgi:hypothetical protein
MGELLLSMLGFDHDGTVIYTRKLKGSHYKVGEAVPLMCPHPKREVKRNYYRILEKLYDPETIVELLKTQDPNVIDQNGFVTFQRRMAGKDMMNLLGQRHSFQQIGQRYGISKHAVELSIKLYNQYVAAEANKEAAEIAELTHDDEPKLTPEAPSEKIKRLMADWGIDDDDVSA